MQMGRFPQPSLAWTVTVVILTVLMAACTDGPAQPPPELTAVADAVPQLSDESPLATLETTANSTAQPPEVCLTRDELGQMSLAERSGLALLCYRSADGIETRIDQSHQIAGIRAFLGDPSRLMGFREIAFMPNSPDGRLRTALYEDERGLQYYYAVDADKVVEMSPAAYAPVVGEVKLPEDELRAIAESLVQRELPEFGSMKAGLTASGGEKPGGLHFFRWEGAPVAGEGSMPPLAQVGVTASGEVFSYVNTLYYLK